VGCVSGGCSECVCRFTEERMEFAKKLHEPEDGCGTCGFWRDSLEDCTKCGKVHTCKLLSWLLWHYLTVVLLWHST
jgi:hypothetical protein